MSESQKLVQDIPGEPQRPTRPRYTRRLLWLLGLILLVPLGLIVLVFPSLELMPFDSPEQIQPGQIRSLKVQILNRSALDGGDDIPAFYADPADFARLLQPLLDTPVVPEFVGARGPWFGEYRIITVDGRRGTIRLYYVPNRTDQPAESPLRFQIGSAKFEGGQARQVIEAAIQASARGRRKL